MKLMPQEIIAHKRDGLALSQAEVEQFVSGVVSGDFKDYQSSALISWLTVLGRASSYTYFS